MRSVLEKIARAEGVDTSFLEEKIRQNRVVVPLNGARKNIERPVAIGEGLTVKVNANIGGSPDITDIVKELKKLRAAVEYGADTVMDLSIGDNWKEVLSAVLENSAVPVGTVPVYAAICRTGSPEELVADDFLDVIRKQGEMGVDFMTIHSGVTRKVIDIYDKKGRTGGIVSRGGKLLYRWMKKNCKENPLYERFDDILDIAREFNITLSLGDGLRPGCIEDASDDPQFAELYELGELTARCRDRKVGVMIEGPGHVPLDKIEENVRKEKEICKGAPFYVLGPLATDVGAGHDHITGAIGGALAAWKGADFLCYLTPAEHLHLPEVEDVYRGVVATKIAAHCADVARGNPRALEADLVMSKARRSLDWSGMEKHAMDPKLVKDAREKYPVKKEKTCTMCGEYCALAD
ncbi:MAG: phosphomethylpyrimidine synthase ThiC [Elusimicrobia bacterium]|nr:phosphomethylpyrimidine synthase ThiC [Elusimicrobiota bacterium]